MRGFVVVVRVYVCMCVYVHLEREVVPTDTMSSADGRDYLMYYFTPFCL